MQTPSGGWERLDPTPLFALWREHYGVAPERFDGLAFYRRTESDSLWALCADVPPPRQPVPETLGLRVRRGDKPDTQVANAFARRYFAGATRHAVTLTGPEDIAAYFASEVLALAPQDGDGYYLVLSPYGVLGRARAHGGQLRGEPSKSERTDPVL